MLTSYFDIQEFLLIFLNLTKFSQEQKLALILYTLSRERVPTVFIIILNCKNKLVRVIVSLIEHVISLFPSEPWGEIRLGDYRDF